jgi:hypothetical protein
VALDQLAAGGADGLVVAKLTWLSRSVADFAQVLRVAKKQKWTVVALDLGIDTGTVNGRLVVVWWPTSSCSCSGAVCRCAAVPGLPCRGARGLTLSLHDRVARAGGWRVRVRCERLRF